MALETLAANFGRALSQLFGSGSGRLRNILVELQGYTTELVAGTTATTNIPVAGIATEDTIQSVIGHDPDNATPALQVLDLTSEASITSAGNIQLSTTNTTGYDLVVTWFNKTP